MKLLRKVCNKEKKLKPLNSVILRDSQTCLGRWKSEMQTSFTLILSLELESRFGLETQVGTSHRKQRNVVSLHSAQCNRTALGSLKMQPSWTWLMKYSTAAWADTQSLLSNRRSLQQGWHLVQHLTLSHRALMEQCNKHRDKCKDITLLKSFVPISRTTEAYPADLSLLYTLCWNQRDYI